MHSLILLLLPASTVLLMQFVGLEYNSVLLYYTTTILVKQIHGHLLVHTCSRRRGYKTRLQNVKSFGYVYEPPPPFTSSKYPRRILRCSNPAELLLIQICLQFRHSQNATEADSHTARHPHTDYTRAGTGTGTGTDQPRIRIEDIKYASMYRNNSLSPFSSSFQSLLCSGLI